MGLSTGARVGAYEITESLGRGGMSEVYRARDLTLERNVAIKVLPESLAAGFAGHGRPLRDRQRARACYRSPLPRTLCFTKQASVGHRFGVLRRR